MVKLNRIYTRTGDDGTTGLVGGSRRSKSDPRVVAYGTVDELNAFIGMCVGVCGDDEAMASLLREIQHDLFDLGADLATPFASSPSPESATPEPAEADSALRIVPSQVQHLEAAIDERNRHLQPLNSFVLPGGSEAARWLHLARAVCRRAERDCVALAEREAINPVAIEYLNRLSDLLFVCAREANDHGHGHRVSQSSQ